MVCVSLKDLERVIASSLALFVGSSLFTCVSLEQLEVWLQEEPGDFAGCDCEEGKNVVCLDCCCCDDDASCEEARFGKLA